MRLLMDAEEAAAGQRHKRSPAGQPLPRPRHGQHFVVPAELCVDGLSSLDLRPPAVLRIRPTVKCDEKRHRARVLRASSRHRTRLRKLDLQRRSPAALSRAVNTIAIPHQLLPSISNGSHPPIIASHPFASSPPVFASERYIIDVASRRCEPASITPGRLASDDYRPAVAERRLSHLLTCDSPPSLTRSVDPARCNL